MAAISRRQLHERFHQFNRAGGKFRLGVINVCNLDCFFCHNEGMVNPRRLAKRDRPADSVGADTIIALGSTYARLGGSQINLTGGEPLAHPEFERIVCGIDKRQTRIAVNTNAVLADRLLDQPRIAAIDTILASLHTTDDDQFRQRMVGRSVSRVMVNIARLKRHGYRMIINFSLSAHNVAEFADVLDFAVANDITLKAIALVRSTTATEFYDGEWVDPGVLEQVLASRGAAFQWTKRGMGGVKTGYTVGTTAVEVKNVATGKLHTDFCRGCVHKAQCGEGIYGLRIGVDGLIKPCLLRKQRYRRLSDADFELQILEAVSAMVGDWDNAQLVPGAPC